MKIFYKRGHRDEVNNYLRLGDHPNIPKLIHHEETETHMNLCIELIDNSITFKQLVSETIEPEDLLHIVKTFKSTLEYIHSRHVIHGDLKNLANILYQKEKKRIVIIDFEFSATEDEFEEFKEADNAWAAFVLFSLFIGKIKINFYDDFLDGIYCSMIIKLESLIKQYSSDSVKVEILKEIYYLFSSTGMKLKSF